MVELSIIMPCYKRVDQTIKTIDLLLASNGLNESYKIELIISDSSPDDSLETVLKTRFRDQIVYTRPKRIGIASSKNHGASIASYPILVFSDSDIELESDTLLNTIEALKQHQKVAGIMGQVIWKGGNKEGSLDRPRAEDRIFQYDKTVFIEAIYSRYIATYKEVFFALGGYDEDVFNMRGEGSDLSIRYWQAGYPLAYDDSIKVHHVFEAADAVTRHFDHPEADIAKDLFLLGYKYDLFSGENSNFKKTINANFAPLKEEGYYRILEGIYKYYDLLITSKDAIDKWKKKPRQYDFKFLEVFDNTQKLQNCINDAEKKLNKLREKIFS